MNLELKRNLRQKRIWRARRKIAGTSERPRLVVSFSNKHIYAQAIDDRSGNTLVSTTTTSKEVRDQSLKANSASAKTLGEIFGKKATAAGITKVVFDRHGRRYHGCVKAFADAAREAGLEF